LPEDNPLIKYSKEETEQKLKKYNKFVIVIYFKKVRAWLENNKKINEMYFFMLNKVVFPFQKHSTNL
jgi:hypothetical protein